MSRTRAAAYRLAVRAHVLLIGPWLAVAAAAEPPHRLQTEHLVLDWVESLSEEEVAAAVAAGEGAYTALRALLGYEPPTRVAMLLGGPAERPDGSREYPRVDRWGRILLFRFDGRFQSYLSPIAHELVHVFRLSRRSGADWFFEEGFAEFAARRVDPSLRGFPWYGFPVVVAAGHWLAWDEAIPLATLRSEHRRLNQRCKAQAYSLRYSFFDHLGRTYGDAKVLAMSNEPRAGVLHDYERFFGRPFEDLEAEWRRALLERYRSTDGVEASARRYREATPIQYMEVCRAGHQFAAP